MSTISLAIVTDDRHYAEALARALQEVSRGFMPTIHTRDAFLTTWQRRGWDYRDSFALILWDGSEIENLCGGNLIWLTDRPADAAQPGDESGGESEEPRFRIGKYSTASVLAARLTAIYEQLTGESISCSGAADADVIAFASWQGGAGCTTVALAVGQDMTRFYGRRVLVITLDPVEATTEYMARPQGAAGVEEYLYRLFGAETMPAPDRFLIRDGYGVEALAPSAGRNPLGILSGEEADRALRALAGSGRFDAVLVDAGCSCSEAALAVIRSANRICLVERRPQPDREERYRSWLRSELGEGGLAGSLRVDNGQPEQEEEGGSGKQRRPAVGRPQGREHAPGRIRLAERQTLSPEILLEGDFGRDIHALTERLCYNNIPSI
ncbi:MAG: hypothetical protein Q4F96_01555 [Bacillota bacterium]|nr:hypothetical protein [Bacillota bacterium]